jgi:putative transposase
MVEYATATHPISERKACQLLKLSRTVYRYKAKPSEDEIIRENLKILAARKPRWGFPKMFAFLRNEGHRWNHKSVRRIYRALGLNLRVKPKKRLPSRDPQPLVAPPAANVSWSLDFMHDSLANGRPIRTLNILDEFNREALWIEVHTSIPSARVTRVLEMLALWRGYPQQLRSDNGPEFISRTMQAWAEEHQVLLAFIQPGKPAQNAFMERFNRTYREEVLDAYLFHSIEEVQALTQEWLEEHNAIRPHEALGGLPPYQFALQQP